MPAKDTRGLGTANNGCAKELAAGLAKTRERIVEDHPELERAEAELAERLRREKEARPEPRVRRVRKVRKVRKGAVRWRQPAEIRLPHLAFR